MIVLDVETTGTEPSSHSLLSIGAVEFENPSNRFYVECRIWDGAHIMEEALIVNGITEAEARDPKRKSDREAVVEFLAWIETCKERTIAGQSPAFDRDFIKAAALRYHLDWPLAHRTIDLHSLCYFHMIQNGIVPPTNNDHSDLNSDKIMSYVGIPEEPKPHNALNGALYETEAFSRLMYKRSLLAEFEKYPLPWKER